MSGRSWRGSLIFVAILAAMGATVGLRLYDSGGSALSAAPGTSAAPQPSAASTPGAAPSPTPTTSAGAAPAPATDIVTGSAVNTRYGVVQVSVTFVGTRITAVKAVRAPSNNGRDLQIDQQALPILEREAISSQTASIDSVSGATYTSGGYKQSLQSAIDMR